MALYRCNDRIEPDQAKLLPGEPDGDETSEAPRESRIVVSGESAADLQTADVPDRAMVLKVASDDDPKIY